MKELNFLEKIKREGKLKLVEVSEEVKISYLSKSENCLKSAKILFENQLYENSISEAYYSMYNSLLALLFKVGIKSENHSASIILLDKLFDTKLAKIISWAKEERIDKQYYVETEQTSKMNAESCREIVSKAENFLVNMKILIEGLNNEKIISIRKNFEDLFGNKVN